MPNQKPVSWSTTGQWLVHKWPSSGNEFCSTEFVSKTGWFTVNVLPIIVMHDMQYVRTCGWHHAMMLHVVIVRSHNNNNNKSWHYIVTFKHEDEGKFIWDRELRSIDEEVTWQRWIDRQWKIFHCWSVKRNEKKWEWCHVCLTRVERVRAWRSGINEFEMNMKERIGQWQLWKAFIQSVPTRYSHLTLLSSLSAASVRIGDERTSEDVWYLTVRSIYIYVCRQMSQDSWLTEIRDSASSFWVCMTWHISEVDTRICCHKISYFRG